MEDFIVINREQIRRHSIAATILVWAPLVPIFWFILKPVMTEALAEELTETVQNTVEEAVEPIKYAFVGLLETEIRDLTLKIARLEFKRDNTDDWSTLDAQELANLNLALRAARDSKEELKAKSD